MGRGKSSSSSYRVRSSSLLGSSCMHDTGSDPEDEPGENALASPLDTRYKV